MGATWSGLLLWSSWHGGIPSLRADRAPGRWGTWECHPRRSVALALVRSWRLGLANVGQQTIHLGPELLPGGPLRGRERSQRISVADAGEAQVQFERFELEPRAERAVGI